MNIDSVLMGYIYGILLAVVGIAILVSAFQSLSKLGVRRRLDQFINEPANSGTGGKSRLIITREYSGSLFSRTLVPWVRRIINNLAELSTERIIQNLDHQLSIAKNPFAMSARTFFGVRVLIVILGVVLAVLLNLKPGGPSISLLLFGIAIVMLSFLVPHYWLLGQVRKTQDEIRRGMPDVLDMLSVCTSAGMSFDQAILKISDYWGTTMGLEFKRVIQEMEMGFSRTEALRNMSNRLDVLELSSFVAVIIQAETLGMQIADVLRGQAAQMRIVRQLRAREISNQLPAKMIFPLVFFILPALLAVLMGPAIPSLLGLMDIK